MDIKLVKTAPGRRLRLPTTGRVMTNVDDDGAPHPVDLDDPHWYRARKRGDIVVVQAPKPATAAPAPAVPPPSATTAAQSASGASASKAAPAPMPSASTEG